MSIRPFQERERPRSVERDARSALALDIRNGRLDALGRQPQVMSHVSDRILDGQIKDPLPGFLIREARGVEQRSIQATPACAGGCKNEQPGKLTGNRSQTLERRMHVEKEADRSVIGGRGENISREIVAGLRGRPVSPAKLGRVRANERALGLPHWLGVSPGADFDRPLDWSPTAHTNSKTLHTGAIDRRASIVVDVAEPPSGC